MLGGLKEKVDVKPLDEILPEEASLNVSYCNSLGENEVHGKLGRLLARQTLHGIPDLPVTVLRQ